VELYDLSKLTDFQLEQLETILMLAAGPVIEQSAEADWPEDTQAPGA
jgi:hypothetical protein